MSLFKKVVLFNYLGSPASSGNEVEEWEAPNTSDFGQDCAGSLILPFRFCGFFPFFQSLSPCHFSLASQPAIGVSPARACQPLWPLLECVWLMWRWPLLPVLWRHGVSSHLFLSPIFFFLHMYWLSSFIAEYRKKKQQTFKTQVAVPLLSVFLSMTM